MSRLEGFTKMLCEFAPGKSKWSPEEMPDLTGKVIIVTGGNTGIGYETAQALLLKNATVYIGARSIAKGEAAIQSLKAATENEKVFLLQMDLADLPTVKKAAEEFQQKEAKLHVLINNAGIMNTPADMLTTQKYDAQFDPVRLIEVTSDGHLLNAFTGADLIHYDTLISGEARDAIGSMQLYFQSKSANILVSKARTRLFAGKNIISMSVHPGRIKSELVRHSSAMEVAVAKMILYPTPMGAITSLYAATAPEAANFDGKYLGPWARVREPRSDHVGNVVAEDKLIAWLEDQLRANNVL